jgi:hypothetical protein
LVDVALEDDAVERAVVTFVFFEVGDDVDTGRGVGDFGPLVGDAVGAPHAGIVEST